MSGGRRLILKSNLVKSLCCLFSYLYFPLLKDWFGTGLTQSKNLQHLLYTQFTPPLEYILDFQSSLGINNYLRHSSLENLWSKTRNTSRNRIRNCKLCLDMLFALLDSCVNLTHRLNVPLSVFYTWGQAWGID